MKYVSIDIETTGLNPETDQILEIAAVVADSAHIVPDHMPMSGFHCRIKHDRLSGDPFALQLNADLIRGIEEDFHNPTENKRGAIYSPGRTAVELHHFLCCEFGKADEVPEATAGMPHTPAVTWRTGNKVHVCAAGKNFRGFDYQFITRLPGWGSPDRRKVQFQHRTMDPVMMWFDPDKDSELPSLDVCMQRAGLAVVNRHTATQDAIDVIRVMEAAWQGKTPDNYFWRQ